MKEQLGTLGIKMTELSQYMKISRPSLYKYVDAYDNGSLDVIPEKIVKFFKYLDKHKSITKEQVITLAICEFGDTDSSDRLEYIRAYLLKAGRSNIKVELIYQLISTTVLDDVVTYLTNCVRILSEGPRNDSEIYQVSRLLQMKENVTTNEPLTDEEFEHIKKLIKMEE